jgi:hypothetical protein
MIGAVIEGAALSIWWWVGGGVLCLAGLHTGGKQLFNKMPIPVMKLRNQVHVSMYKRVLKPIFFWFDPQTMHDVFTHIGEFASSVKIIRAIVSLVFGFPNTKVQSRILSQKLCGIVWPLPVGLAAGFDKNAKLGRFPLFVISF